MHHYNYGSTQKGDGRGTAAFGQCTHPVFRTQEDTGKKAVYVNRLMTVGIVDMPPEESDRCSTPCSTTPRNANSSTSSLARGRSPAVGQPLLVACAHRFLLGRTPADAAHHGQGHGAAVLSKQCDVRSCKPQAVTIAPFSAPRTISRRRRPCSTNAASRAWPHRGGDVNVGGSKAHRQIRRYPAGEARSEIVTRPTMRRRICTGASSTAWSIPIPADMYPRTMPSAAAGATWVARDLVHFGQHLFSAATLPKACASKAVGDAVRGLQIPCASAPSAYLIAAVA